DNSFGNSGFAKNVAIPRAASVVQAPNGDLLAGGTAGPADNSAAWDLGVAAFLPGNGAPDLTFGMGGLATADFGGFDRGRAMAFQPDGKIVASGFTNFVNGGSDSNNMTLARFLPPNTKITSFSASPAPVISARFMT